jgi:hypothetical protein
MRKKWEYKQKSMVGPVRDNRLDLEGAEGWELVSVNSLEVESDESGVWFLFIFKREIT